MSLNLKNEVDEKCQLQAKFDELKEEFYLSQVIFFLIWNFKTTILPVTRDVSISSETNFYDENTCYSMGII